MKDLFQRKSFIVAIALSIFSSIAAVASLVKEFESEHVRFVPFSQADTSVVYSLMKDPEATKHSYGPRKEEWIEKLIKVQLEEGRKTPLGAWVLYAKEGEQPIGCCGFKAGDKETTFKEGPDNPAGEGVPAPEAGGRRKKDRRTELGSSSILLYPHYNYLRSEISAALIEYAFTQELQLVGIDFGVQETNESALKDMKEIKKITLLVDPYPVKREGKPDIMMHVFRLDREQYQAQAPFTKIEIKP